jgi:hypothetical protein
MPSRIALVILLSFPFFLAALARQAVADYVMLRSGGEIRGELLGDAKSKVSKSKEPGERVSIRMLSGATVEVVKSEVEGVVRRRMIVEEYETRRRSLPDTLEAHWELAGWCREKSLSKEREVHLRRVIEFEPEHLEAHRALGHIRHQGKWMTHDELMTSRGYVKHKGKYVLPQELELIRQDEHVTEAEKSWFRRVRTWHGWLDSDHPERQNEALTQLQAIKEPDAVPALARSFRGVSNEQQRLLYVQILGKIEGDKPLQPLILQSLWDESRLVRQSAIKGVRRKDLDKALPAYVRALKHGMNLIVNRAGSALEDLGNDDVIPRLIDALVTRHQYTVLVPDAGLRPGDMVPVGTPILPPSVELMAATGQLPYGAQVQVWSPTPPRMKEMTIEKDEENPSVLSALATLTGENLGYDEPAWRKWYNAQHNLKQFPNNSRKKKPKP